MIEQREGLGEPSVLKKRLLALAALDIIVCDEEWLRYHSFDTNWTQELSLAKIDNGSGDHLFVVFGSQGVILKGFDHESALSPHAGDVYEVWPGIYDQVPDALMAYLQDPALEHDVVTFCIWRASNEGHWQQGEVELPHGADDGSRWLLGTINKSPEDYVEWAEGYYDLSLDMETVKQIFAGAPITAEMIQLLYPDRDVEQALMELNALGDT
ncbi:hypothetical protein [Paenibacillus sp. FSL H8-0034]|uniref:hypothetical protein n=1 Tax=Paenibacillus sp. FSL H8-0034 TaxID=2954671 RepID=UPI0030F7918F